MWIWQQDNRQNTLQLTSKDVLWWSWYTSVWLFLSFLLFCVDTCYHKYHEYSLKNKQTQGCIEFYKIPKRKHWVVQWMTQDYLVVMTTRLETWQFTPVRIIIVLNWPSSPWRTFYSTADCGSALSSLCMCGWKQPCSHAVTANTHTRDAEGLLC